MTDVADRLVHSRSGLTYRVAQLAGAGLVAKEASAEDERSVIVALTPHGRELLAAPPPPAASVRSRGASAGASASASASAAAPARFPCRPMPARTRVS
ncbi:MAG TPA: MarR family transcriptional regulator [Actinospica sp.]|nr:MarR family transcriptional regulator [Actinospica sp.]